MPTISITVDAATATRVQHAFGRYWNKTNEDGSPRDATNAEVKEYLVRQLKGVVRQQEQREAEAALILPAEIAAT